jgi:hypothetical protein
VLQLSWEQLLLIVYVTDDAPPENRLGLSFKEGQRLDVTSCGGAMWTAVTEDQIVGEFPREIGHRCLNITVILQASVNADCEGDRSFLKFANSMFHRRRRASG